MSLPPSPRRCYRAAQAFSNAWLYERAGQTQRAVQPVNPRAVNSRRPGAFPPPTRVMTPRGTAEGSYHEIILGDASSPAFRQLETPLSQPLEEALRNASVDCGGRLVLVAWLGGAMTGRAGAGTASPPAYSATSRISRFGISSSRAAAPRWRPSRQVRTR
jgi:hypothetical protein